MITNKQSQGKKGTIVAILSGTKSEVIIPFLQQIPLRKRKKITEITLDLTGNMGFMMMYKETKNADYLKTAQKAAKFYMNNSNLPKDKIPFWDFNAHQKGYNSDVDFTGRNISPIPRDASAAAIVTSALIDLSQFSEGKDKKLFLNFAKESLKSLSSPKYFADYKTNGGFLLKHSVGSLPHNSEVDVPLTYADYYYLEALTRLKELK